MVMISMRSTDGLCSQRMNSTSISPPIAMVIATAAATASGRGSSGSSEMAIMPPSMTNSPWAKLMMPVAL